MAYQVALYWKVPPYRGGYHSVNIPLPGRRLDTAGSRGGVGRVEDMIKPVQGTIRDVRVTYTGIA